MGAEPGPGAALPAQELGGSFALGWWRVHRAGYGAMQPAVDGVFGPPRGGYERRGDPVFRVA